MPSAKLSKDLNSGERLEETTRILRDLRSPDELVQTASQWLSSNLYQQYTQKDPQSPPYQVLKTLLSDVLLELEEENKEYAEILRDRFWKGLAAKELVMSFPWSERTFFSMQSKAIKLYDFLLNQREQTCLNHLSQQPLSIPEPLKKTKNEGRSPSASRPAFGGHLLYGTILLVLGVSFLWILSLFSNKEQPLPVGSQTSEGQLAEGLSETAIVQTTTHEEIPPFSICGEKDRITSPSSYRFVRWEGVSVFNIENTDGGVLSDRVRALANSPDGLWVGYFSNPGQNSGVGHYDKVTWASCLSYSGGDEYNVNAMLVDSIGRVWIGFERQGIALFYEGSWNKFTIEDGLPSNSIYGIAVDESGVIWVGTWEGIARYDGVDWTVPYTVMNDTIYNNRVHSIAFDSDRNIWVGHVSDGISQYSQERGEWIHYTERRTGLSSDRIRDILVKHGSDELPESVWFATSGGGVSKYEAGEWTAYGIKDGLPGNDIRALAIDHYGRVWAATDRGVAYLEEAGWVLYHSLSTQSISIAQDCEGCVFDGDVVWTGTVEHGLTHSRLPHPEPVLDVRSICFVNAQRERLCPEMEAEEIDNVLYITAQYPLPLSPDDTLRFEVTTTPRANYQLRDNRGDFLSNADKNDFNLFGAWPIIGVGEVVEPGQPYTFTDYDNPFVAPQLFKGEMEKTFVSTWRVWMHTRYSGPYIRLVFRVVN
jgi:hypothetical protein